MCPLYYCREELDQLPAQTLMGVIGNPIAHSKSPAMQQAALDSAGFDYRYARLECEVKIDAFPCFLEDLTERGFFALNVTVPFKRSAFMHAVQVDQLSQLCEASNTLLRQEDGWHAYNTDGPGFQQAVEKKWGQPLAESSLVVLGSCGGAGAAIAAQAAIVGCKRITLVNRPRPELKAQLVILKDYAPHLDIACYHFDSPDLKEVIALSDLIVNATVLGLAADDPMPLPLSYLQPYHRVYDIVSHETAFHRAAASLGCRCSTGEEMLLWQGALAFEHWFKQSPDVAAMKKALNL